MAILFDLHPDYLSLSLEERKTLISKIRETRAKAVESRKSASIKKKKRAKATVLESKVSKLSEIELNQLIEKLKENRSGET